MPQLGHGHGFAGVQRQQRRDVKRMVAALHGHEGCFQRSERRAVTHASTVRPSCTQTQDPLTRSLGVFRLCARPVSPTHAAHVAEGIHRLSLADLTNLAVEAPDTPMHQGALGVLDGELLLDVRDRIRIDLVRARMALKLDRLPELRRVLFQTGPLQGRSLWVDDPNFQIENHVLVAQLPAPGGQAEALRFAEKKMSGLMDRTRPLWELWFLEGYGDGRVGLFLKLHHVLADGPAILNMLAQLFDLEPGPACRRSSGWLADNPPSPRALALDNLARKARLVASVGRRLTHPLALARIVFVSARGTWEALKQGRGAPRTSFNRPVGAGRRIAVMHFSLAEMKSIGHSEDATVNDVFLHLVAGGLREVLSRRGEPVGQMRIHASVAVSLHPAGDAAPVGNHVGTMIVPLPIGVDDPATRLGLIASDTRKAKARQRAAVPQVLMVMLAISGLTRFFVRRQRLVNVLVTNLPGPQFPLYVAGARLRDAFAIPPIAGNVTVSFAGLSYDGRFDLSIHADSRAWPDVDVLMEGMRTSWERLARCPSNVVTGEAPACQPERLFTGRDDPFSASRRTSPHRRGE